MKHTISYFSLYSWRGGGDNGGGAEEPGEALAQLHRRLRLRPRPLLPPHGPPGTNISYGPSTLNQVCDSDR